MTTLASRAIVRPARGCDADSVSRVYRSSWRAAFGRLLAPELVPDEVLRARGALLVDGPCCVVGVVDRSVVCFAAGNPSTGQLSMLYADPSCWGTGIAGAVLSTVTSTLQVSGYRPTLWMWEANSRAAAFYARHGWVHDGREKVARVAGVEFRYVGLTAPDASGPPKPAHP